MARPVLATDALQRRNYRDVAVPTGGGIVIVVVVVVATGLVLLADANGWDLDRATVGPRAAVITAVLGLGFLGLLDDLAGAGQSGGFRGHLTELAKGRLTTGSL